MASTKWVCGKYDLNHFSFAAADEEIESGSSAPKLKILLNVHRTQLGELPALESLVPKLIIFTLYIEYAPTCHVKYAAPDQALPRSYC